MRSRTPEEYWAGILTGRRPHLRLARLFKVLPGAPRCKLCNLPMGPPSGPVLRLVGKRPSKYNPRAFCNWCDKAVLKYRGGAEVEMSLLFADVRGSTAIAQGMSPTEFTELMNRFYVTSNDLLLDSDAFVDKMVGDEVIALYFPWLADHPARAVRAGEQLLVATGHADPKGPWLPIGVGVHTGTAYFGVVGSTDTLMEMTALGDAVNVTARLASMAAAGEIMVSEAAYSAAGITADHERRQIDIRGHDTPLDVRILRVDITAG